MHQLRWLSIQQINKKIYLLSHNTEFIATIREMADYPAITAALYERLDSDKNGTLEPVEIRPFFDELIAARADLGFTADDFEKWFGSIDQNADGTIAPDELEGYLASINYSA